MPPSLAPLQFLLLLGLLAGPLRAAVAGESEPLETVRAKDQVTIFAGTGLMSFTQVIVVEPIRVEPGRERPGNPNLVQLLVTPLWIKQDDSVRPAFRVLRPRLNLSHGRVRRFVLTQRDGESVASIEKAPRDAVYVLTIELGHVVPKQLTITIDLATGGINRNMELQYTASNDGRPVRSGPPSSVFTELKVFADGALQPWRVLQGDTTVQPLDSATVHLEREVMHAIRFGPSEG